MLDIRYYESDVENVDGVSLPGYVGRLYTFPKSIHSLGARIARKLREYEFVAGEFDHLYVNFTNVLSPGEFHFSPRTFDKRIKYVDYGLDPPTVNSLSDVAKESLVTSATFDILNSLSQVRSGQLAIVDRVRSEIESKGSELEILHKTKETTSYSVVVTYQIRPKNEQSVALVEYIDKKTGSRQKTTAVKLLDYEDVFSLIGSITVSRGVVTLKPRASFKASLYTNRYKVPIEIQLQPS